MLHTKISNHNIIYSSYKPRKSSSPPLKSSSWLFSLNASLSSYKRCTGIYKFGNNTYPRRIRCRSNLGHIFREHKCILWARKYGTYFGLGLFVNRRCMIYLTPITLAVCYCIYSCMLMYLCLPQIWPTQTKILQSSCINRYS